MTINRKGNDWLLPAALLSLILTISVFQAQATPTSGAKIGAGAKPEPVTAIARLEPRPEATPTGEPTRTPVATKQPATSGPASPTSSPTPTLTPTPSPTPFPDDVNPLTGLKVGDAAQLRRRPLLVRIGNDPQIRPQTGLSQADVVYEELIDGYPLTRLSAIFLAYDPPLVGPIRSARLVTIQLARQYQAALVHSGASDAVRWEIAREVQANLDEYFHPRPYISNKNRDWRSRLFASVPVMRAYMKEIGMEAAVKLSGFAFSDDGETPEGGVDAPYVTIPYPEDARVEWKYNLKTGRYLRFVAGQPFTDAAGGQVSAANVVVYYAEHKATDIIEDASGATSVQIVVKGEGAAEVIRDGRRFSGHWSATGDSLPQFLDDAGQPIPFKPGNTWIELVPK